MMTILAKIDARRAFELLADPETLLVCAYEGDEEFQQHHLEGAISLHDFLSRKESLRKGQPIIFYCACPHDETANGQASKYQNEGFTNVNVLEGGVHVWKEAGCTVAMSMPPTEIDLDAYFARIRYAGPRKPTLALLHAIVAHHVAAIPFENLDVLLSWPILLEPASLQKKLIHDRRGGYCFEQNVLFLLLDTPQDRRR
ncbi:arylamine N-acetyltransferase-like protein [Candidatus Kuenenia stuttgartiensis]|jgi:rhodanese-related sulfurtransferase|uniref:Arylamine N-acetyltransferase-like protein n=2 Tax=Kuenenia stuttgartiensis TaxID=174633 RepID=Q1Q0E3_KUEST|nr:MULTISPECIES: arylamine N-acetyltransferase [Kuenenia]MBZ0192500.1 arylamine N-acetyltransferase [Candidatus Kuenenia stuttgartiensis]MCF6151067.1 hypothetical protein [Candidatus Kuenenia stuttgartiensis]MCL4727604.1 arylamine N-acetyltransferase [Candidatus Kuenenia stuttgartiensis]MCZ7623482.1 arylamine N-acetyltransferase [Candidatus Kuenenia sp.]QII09827.1 arylamine N-acetyltransferase-like protein [Candidatus Kuenenia stuttgartiensis]